METLPKTLAGCLVREGRVPCFSAGDASVDVFLERQGRIICFWKEMQDPYLIERDLNGKAGLLVFGKGAINKEWCLHFQKSNGFQWSSNGFHWSSMHSDGLPLIFDWIPMHPNGFHWVFHWTWLDSNEFQLDFRWFPMIFHWIPMGFNGFQWISIDSTHSPLDFKGFPMI